MKKDNTEIQVNFTFFNNSDSKTHFTGDYVNNTLHLLAEIDEYFVEDPEKAIYFCFEKAIEQNHTIREPAKRVLLAIVKKTPILSNEMQKYFINILNHCIADENDERAKECAFLVLSEGVDTSNIPLLAELTAAIKIQFKEPSKDKQKKAMNWLEILFPKLATLEDDLVDAVILFFENSLSFRYSKILKDMTSKLSNTQSANYLDRFLPLLQSDIEEQRIKGCIMLSPLAANMSPCPEDIYRALIVLSRHTDQKTSLFALKSLSNLEPNRLVIESDVIVRALAGGTEYQFVFEWIIKLEPMMVAQDITDEWIDGLVNSKKQTYGWEFLPKKQAYPLLIEKMNDTQLNTYVNKCLDLEDMSLKGRLLTAVRLEKLQQYNLEDLFVQFTTLLKSNNMNIRYNACDGLKKYKSMLHMFPNTVICDYLMTLEDNVDYIRTAAFKTLPLLLHFIPDQFIEKVLVMILNNISMAVDNIFSWKTATQACDCLTTLAPKLDISQIALAIEKLTLLPKGSDNEALNIRRDIFIKFDETLVFLTDLHKSKLLQKELMQSMEDPDVQNEERLITFKF